MGHLLTSKEGIALDIIFGMLGETRFNREFDDWGSHYKYVYVASRAPKLAAMHSDVNKILRQVADAGSAPFEICYFKPGDRYHWYEEFPTSLSLETIRKAWVKSGMRQLQLEQKRTKAISKRSH